MNELQVFDKLKADITLKIAPSLTIKVTDNDSMNNAKLAGKEAKHFFKLIEDKRKELIAPLLERQRTINAVADSLKEPLNNCEKHLKGELLKFELKLAEERRKEQQKLDEERKAKEAALEQERIAKEKALADQKKLAQDLGLEDCPEQKRLEIIEREELSRKDAELKKEVKAEEKKIEAMSVGGIRHIWAFEVESLKDVPFEFLTIDEKKVKEFMQSKVKAKETPELAGIKFFQKQSASF